MKSSEKCKGLVSLEERGGCRRRTMYSKEINKSKMPALDRYVSVLILVHMQEHSRASFVWVPGGLSLTVSAGASEEK